jgi:hypothetical protein
MPVVSRRLLITLLVLALALSACGRGTPRVTADDGRGVDRSNGIWIPETRDVDPGPDMRAQDDEEDEDDEVGAGGAADGEDGERPGEQRDAEPEAAASEPSRTTRTAPEASDAPRPRQAAAPTTRTTAEEPASDETEGTARPEEPEEEDEEVEPAEPETVGDCGTSSSSPPPSRERLEAAVERLRAEVRERWPETQAGAWILEDPTEVHVAFTEGVRAALRRLCETFEHPDLLRGVRAELSEAELEEVLATVDEERDALRDGDPPRDMPEPIRATKGRYTAAVDHAANALTVTVERADDALLRAFRERYTARLHLAEGEVDEAGTDGT